MKIIWCSHLMDMQWPFDFYRYFLMGLLSFNCSLKKVAINWHWLYSRLYFGVLSSLARSLIKENFKKITNVCRGLSRSCMISSMTLFIFTSLSKKKTHLHSNKNYYKNKRIRYKLSYLEFKIENKLNISEEEVVYDV